MKWEVFVKIVLAIVTQGLVVAILWFTSDFKVLAGILIAVSNLSWISTLWSVYEDIKKVEVVKV